MGKRTSYSLCSSQLGLPSVAASSLAVSVFLPGFIGSFYLMLGRTSSPRRQTAQPKTPRALIQLGPSFAKPTAKDVRDRVLSRLEGVQPLLKQVRDSQNSQKAPC